MNGMIGFVDDYCKLIKHQNEGLKAYQKFWLQVLVAIIYVVLLKILGHIDTELHIPFTDINVELGIVYYGQEVMEKLNVYAQSREGWSLPPSNYEGVRVNLDEAHGNGWFLLRLSLHDPLLPLNIESNSVGGAKKIAAELAGFIAKYDKLDAQKLLDFVK